MNMVMEYLFFPGLLFSVLGGFAASYIDRKVTARIQWRQGPPVLQPLYDFFKLMGKETLVPSGASVTTFLLAPVLSFAVISMVSTIVWSVLVSPMAAEGFVGDLIVVVYLLSIPSIMMIIGGFSSRNPVASLGASREMKLILAYELPFVLSIVVPILQTRSIKLNEIVQAQLAGGAVLGSVSGTLAFIVIVLCVQAKLGLVPFDIAEAEQEIIAGTLVEYSGPPLALFKLTRLVGLFAIPAFVVLLFMPSSSFGMNLLKYALMLVITILIRNTNPRVRIDQAVKFFWTWMSFLAVAAVLLAVIGL